jgi:hypothetical protein
VGFQALANATGSGVANNAFGYKALFSNTEGGDNTANGVQALFSNTTGQGNTAIGFGALYSNIDGNSNIAIGVNALFSHVTGDSNNAVGSAALSGDTQGVSNNAFGDSALSNNTAGSINTAVGDMALANNADGSNNTAVGQQALMNSTGNANTGIGGGALSGNTTGFFNTAVGVNALQNNTTGGNNVVLGAGAGSGVTTASNVICIGANVAGNDVNDSCYIGNIFGDTSSGGTAVFVNSNGRLGTATSSGRFKEEIKPIDKASEAILSLRPVSFRYKKEIDPTGTAQFGLVAEEVEKVNRDLVVRDPKGKPYTVRYEQVNAMLLNEFLKEHKTVQELKSTVQNQEALIAQQQKSFESKLAEQGKQIRSLTAGLQKVSTQFTTASPPAGGVQVNRPAQQVVLNNP